MSNRYTNGRWAFGFCDRCGFRYDLNGLKYEVEDKRRNGLRVCDQCLDVDHPQNWLGDIFFSDPEALFDPRPDIVEDESRKLFAFKPVGHPTTSLISTKIGMVTITTV